MTATYQNELSPLKDLCKSHINRLEDLKSRFEVLTKTSDLIEYDILCCMVAERLVGWNYLAAILNTANADCLDKVRRALDCALKLDSDANRVEAMDAFDQATAMR